MASAIIPIDSWNPTCPDNVPVSTPLLNSSTVMPIPCSCITAGPKGDKLFTLLAVMWSTVSQHPVITTTK